MDKSSLINPFSAGSILDVRIWRLDRRHILTSKGYPALRELQ